MSTPPDLVARGTTAAPVRTLQLMFAVVAVLLVVLLALLVATRAILPDALHRIVDLATMLAAIALLVELFRPPRSR